MRRQGVLKIGTRQYVDYAVFCGDDARDPAFVFHQQGQLAEVRAVFQVADLRSEISRANPGRRGFERAFESGYDSSKLWRKSQASDASHIECDD